LEIKKNTSSELYGGGGKLTSTGRHAMGLIGPWAGPTQTRVSFFLPDEVISSGSERTQLLLRT
jgi:hypothetical protein